MIFSLKNGKQAAEKIADYLGLTKLFQGVVDTNNAVKDINSGKTNLNQKGLDGYAAILANAAASVGWATCCPRVLMSVQAA